MSPALRAELEAAISAYQRECATLIAAYEQGSLSAEWDADPHGEHCRFESSRSGRVVEAPFPDSVPRFAVDPYFLGVFVKTGHEFPLLRSAIAHEFHDTLALLDQLHREEKNA